MFGPTLTPIDFAMAGGAETGDPSTLEIKLPDNGILLSGNVPSLSNYEGHYYATPFQDAQIDFRAKGTDCTMQIYGGDISVTVDGTTTTRSAGAAWTKVTLFSGLANTYHTVSVKNVNALYWEFGNASDTQGQLIQLTGINPAVTRPAGYGFFSVFTDSPLSTKIAHNGYTTASPASFPVLLTPYSHCPIRFRGSFTTLRIWTYLAGQEIYLFRNGALVNKVVAPSTLKFGYVTLSTSEPGTTAVYDVSAGINDGAAYLNFICYGIAGGGAMDESTTNSLDTVVLGIGDSITVGKGGTWKSDGWFPLSTRTRGLQALGYCIGSKSVKYWGSPNIASMLASVTVTPDRVILALGSNDMSGVEGSVTTGEFTTGYTAMLDAILAKWSGIHIDCIEILPRTSYTNPDDWNAAIATAIAASTAPSQCHYRVVSTGFPLSGGRPDPANTTYFADGIHPTTTGYATMDTNYRASL